jgi:hypothetical protein
MSLTEKLRAACAFDEEKCAIESNWRECHRPFYEGTELSFKEGAAWENKRLQSIREMMIECVELLEDATGIGISTKEAEQTLSKLQSLLERGG